MKVLLMVLLAFLTIGGAPQATRKRTVTCCPSVGVSITEKDGEYTFDFNNHSTKAVIAFTFASGGEREYGVLLWGAAFRESYQQVAYLSREGRNAPLELVSVVFDDGNFEGDESFSRWSLAAIRAAEDTHRRLAPRIRAVAAGEASLDTALALSEPQQDLVRIRAADLMDGARQFGENEANELHRAVLQRAQKARASRADISASADMLDQRFSLLRKGAK